MTHSPLARALATCGLSVVLATAAAPAWADGHRPQPRGAGSTLNNTVTSTSNSNCVNGSEAGCSTAVKVTAAPPTVNPGPYPIDGPIDGTGTPGDAITLHDSSGNAVCTAKVLADGSWSCSPANPMNPGTEPLTPIDTTVGPSVPGQTTNATFEAPPAAATPLADPGVVGATLSVGGVAVLVWRRRSRRLRVRT